MHDTETNADTQCYAMVGSCQTKMVEVDGTKDENGRQHRGSKLSNQALSDQVHGTREATEVVGGEATAASASKIERRSSDATGRRKSAGL